AVAGERKTGQGESMFRSGGDPAAAASGGSREEEISGRSPAQNVDVKVLLSQAMASHQDGRLAEAAQSYRAILQRSPAHFDSLHLLGVVHYQRGAYDQAIAQIDAALRINPRSAAAHSNRGVALAALARFEEAVTCYDRAISIKPDYAD